MGKRWHVYVRIRRCQHRIQNKSTDTQGILTRSAGTGQHLIWGASMYRTALLRCWPRIRYFAGGWHRESVPASMVLSESVPAPMVLSIGRAPPAPPSTASSLEKPAATYVGGRRARHGACRTSKTWSEEGRLPLWPPQLDLTIGADSYLPLAPKHRRRFSA